MQICLLQIRNKMIGYQSYEVVQTTRNNYTKQLKESSETGSLRTYMYIPDRIIWRPPFFVLFCFLPKYKTKCTNYEK